MKALILILTSLISLSAFAHELDFVPYLKLQESLAKDDFGSAFEAHKYICDRELIHYKDDYQDCSKKFKDIEEFRTSFKELSNVYLENGNKKELSKLVRATCPMAKAKWVQKPGVLRNPYYGKSMLRCGEEL